MKTSIAPVRLKIKVFHEFRKEWPFLEKNEFEVIEWEAGCWAWIITIRYLHLRKDWRFKLESEDLDKMSQTTILSVLGPHNARIRNLMVLLEAGRQIRQQASQATVKTKTRKRRS